MDLTTIDSSLKKLSGLPRVGISMSTLKLQRQVTCPKTDRQTKKHSPHSVEVAWTITLFSPCLHLDHLFECIFPHSKLHILQLNLDI